MHNLINRESAKIKIEWPLSEIAGSSLNHVEKYSNISSGETGQIEVITSITKTGVSFNFKPNTNMVRYTPMWPYTIIQDLASKKIKTG